MLRIRIPKGRNPPTLCCEIIIIICIQCAIPEADYKQNFRGRIMIVDYKSSAAAAPWNLINAHHTGPGGLAVEARRTVSN